MTSYTLEWSTSSTFPTGSTSSLNLTAAGSHSNVWFVTNTTTGLSTSFVNGTSYYFRARGNIGSSNNTEWAVFGTPTSVKIGANSTGATIHRSDHHSCWNNYQSGRATVCGALYAIRQWCECLHRRDHQPGGRRRITSAWLCPMARISCLPLSTRTTTARSMQAT